MALFLTVEVRLRSGESHGAQNLAGWGPARPQCSESRWLRSAHSAPTLAGRGPARPTALRLSPVEVRRGPLLSRAGRWDPAKLTAIKSWQMRSAEEGGGRRRNRASDIESNNPHLAGGEKNFCCHWRSMEFRFLAKIIDTCGAAVQSTQQVFGAPNCFWGWISLFIRITEWLLIFPNTLVSMIPYIIP